MSVIARGCLELRSGAGLHANLALSPRGGPPLGVHSRTLAHIRRMSLGLQELGFVAEARLEDSGSGLAPVTEGWFVVNVRDAQWWFAESRGAACAFENEYGDRPVEFGQLGINITVLEPGQTSLYHAEENQEAFLVVYGECVLIVEGQERRLRP